MENKKLMLNTHPDQQEHIFTGRIKSLLGQIENFKRIQEECERKKGRK